MLAFQATLSNMSLSTHTSATEDTSHLDELYRGFCRIHVCEIVFVWISSDVGQSAYSFGLLGRTETTRE